MLDASITRALSSRYWKIVLVLALVTLAKLTSIAVPLLLGHIVEGLASRVSAPLYRGPLALEDGDRICQVRDPWGNCIGLRQRRALICRG
ncbi:hypothetical protein ACSC9U_03720 [Pseudomonas solani]|uniref:VOC family protein n=1 Tax=Pseudomonas solani TaxID=2731552 RepID=UPI003F4A9622